MPFQSTGLVVWLVLWCVMALSIYKYAMFTQEINSITYTYSRLTYLLTYSRQMADTGFKLQSFHCPSFRGGPPKQQCQQQISYRYLAHDRKMLIKYNHSKPCASLSLFQVKISGTGSRLIHPGLEIQINLCYLTKSLKQLIMWSVMLCRTWLVGCRMFLLTC